jgi:autotransporter-associated beta strand protein
MFRVDAGTLALGAVGDTSTMLLGQPVELRGGMLASNSGVQNLSAPVTLFNSSVINTTAGTLMVNGTIIGAGNLTFEGAGTTRLANTNSYTGDTYIDAGTQGVAVVRATRSNPFGATGTVYFNPAGNGTRGRIEVQDNITVPNNIVLSARDIASVSIENIGGSNTFSGTLSAQVGGSYYVIQSDAGLLTFSGAASGAGGVAMKSLATGQRTFTLQGAGDGLVSGVIENGSGTVNLLKQGAGTWTLANANTYTGATTVKAGTLKLENSLTSSAAIQVDGGTLELASDGSNLRVISTPALTIGATGRLDLADNKLFTNVPAGTFTGGAYTGVQGEVARAYNFGAWDQPGLMTSEGLAGPNAGGLSGTTTIGVATGEQILFLGLNDTAVFAGQTITGATTVAMYTYAGDLNFDGLVDAADYGVIDNWAQFAGTDGYANGDINYDGVIDAADYGIIDNTIQLQGPPIAVAGAGLLKVTAVPEPASLAVISGALALFGGRCRRRHVN